MYKSDPTGTPTVRTDWSVPDYSSYGNTIINQDLNDKLFAKSVFNDLYGEPIFSVLGKTILDKNGLVIGEMHSDFSQQPKPIRSDFKNVIIPVPDQPGLRDCNKRYYIISLARIPSTSGGSWTHTPRPYYSILNLGEHVNLPPTEKLEYLNAFGSTAQPLDLPLPFHTDPLNPNVGNLYTPFNDVAYQTDVTMNAIKLANSEDYFLVISHLQVLFYYRVTATGIDYLGHFVDEIFAGIGLPNDKLTISDGHLLTSEMEIRLLPNGNYRVAYPIVKNGSFPNGFTPSNFISFVDFTSNLVVEPASKKYIKQFSGIVFYRYYGLEFNDNGNSLLFSTYFSLNEPGLFAADYFNFTNLVSVNSPITGIDALIMAQTNLTRAELSDFARSQIERDGQGNFICTNGRSILKCTNPNSGFTNWVLETNVIPALPAVEFSTGAKSETYFGIYNISAPIYNNLNRAYWSGFDIDELIVDQDATWSPISSPFPNKPIIYIKNKLEIAAGVRLNLENITLRFAPEAKLIIREGTSNKVGGYLNMNNSKLEYDDRCEYAFWQGVQIHGNHDKNQEPYLRPQWQGMLVMENNSEINNAHNGVKLIDPNNWARTGGVVRTYNSKFINNRKAVEFMVYRNLINNSSAFRNTQFVVNDNYIPLQPGAITVRDFNAHVTLYDVKGVTFTACTFENNMTNKLGNSTTNNRGIGSLDAGYKIYGGQNGTTFYPTSFSGFIVGVDGSSTLTGRNLIIENANFTNNANGVIAVNNIQLSVTNTDFNIGTFNFGGVNKNIGIYSFNVSNLKIEQNNLIGNSSLNLERAGVETFRSGANQNRIYKNAANNLNTAFFAQYTNRAFSEFVGLEYNCNLNSGNIDYDFFAKGTQTKTEPEILKYEGVRAFQGNTPVGTTIRAAAGNTFTQNTPSIWHFKNETLHSVKYNYGSGNQEPLYYDNIVYPYLATDANLCLSNPYGPTTGGVITQSKRLLIEQQYATYETEYLNLLYNLNQLIDNGSTTTLLDEMQSSWSDHAWHFRNELLQISPYLSQDALREAINMEILPPAMILEICLANQEVSTSPEFIYWLETEAPVSLPNYMIVLLQQLVPDISARTILQYQIAGYVSEMALIKNELLRYHLNDSLENTQALAALIARNASDGELFTLVDYLAEKGLFTEALVQLNLMADMPNQSENFADLLADYATYLNFRADLAADERNLAQLDSSELSFAITNANANDPKIAGRYRAFLCFLYEYCEFTDLETQGRKAQPKQVKNTKKALVKQEVRVFPNPATDAVSVYLENFSNLEGTIQLRMLNAQGKTVLNEQVLAGTNIVNLNVSGKPAGIYMLEVWNGSERLFIEKLVIKN